MHILLVFEEGRFMRCTPSFNLKKWALPLSLDGTGRFWEVGFLCFSFKVTRGESIPLRHEMRELTTEETANYHPSIPGRTPEAAAASRAAVEASLANADDKDMFDDEYEDEEEEETTSAS